MFTFLRFIVRYYIIINYSRYEMIVYYRIYQSIYRTSLQVTIKTIRSFIFNFHLNLKFVTKSTLFRKKILLLKLVSCTTHWTLKYLTSNVWSTLDYNNNNSNRNDQIQLLLETLVKNDSDICVGPLKWNKDERVGFGGREELGNKPT